MSALASTSALILAGGLGTRLRSVVADRPKVLAEVDGRPFLFKLFDVLIASGVKHVILATGHRAEDIADAVAGGYPGIELELSEERSPRGTGGAIALAAPHLRSPRALVLNGDSFCVADLCAFMREHRQRHAVASMVVTPVADVRRYGEVILDEASDVMAFSEKRASRGAGLINAGIYLLEAALIDAIPRRITPVSFEREILPRWVGRGLYAYRSDGPFIDIGIPSTYARADRFFAEVGVHA